MYSRRSAYSHCRRCRSASLTGELREVPIGEVEAEIDGRRMPILCFFGAKDVPALLGAHALEAFLLSVDPVEQKLVPREAILMYRGKRECDGMTVPTRYVRTGR